MPTKKKRLFISLSPELAFAVERLAQVSRKPQSTVVSELLEAVTPFLHAQASLLAQAPNEPLKALETVLGMAEAARLDAVEQATNLKEQLSGEPAVDDTKSRVDALRKRARKSPVDP